MSLSTNITLTVSNYNIKLSRNLKFYENDQLKLIFTLNYFGIDNANGVKQKIPMPLNALSAILFIETPLGVDSIESATVEENVVTFYLTSNQTRHIGVSRMQIQLSDADGCQITLPPMEFEVKKNIYDNEVILSQVLLADEDKNIVVDKNGSAINTGTQVSSQTYPIALSNEDEIISVASQPTKQIKDFNLKTDVSGEEDLLIQDSDGVTKRIKAFEFLNVNVDLTLYYTKEEVNALLNNKADIVHTHTVADIEDMPDYALKTDIPTNTSDLINNSGFITIDEVPEVDLTGYATETFVTNKIAEASLGGGGEVDLSGYATKDELNSSLATKSDTTHNHDTVYAPIEHEHSQYLTSVPSEYVTDTELESKGYLTEHQDISNLATKAEVQTKADVNHIHSQYLTTIPTEYITETELADALSTKANTSDIPSLEGYATETYVTNKIAEASLSGGEVDLSGYATKDELTVGLAKKSNVEHIHSYNDLTNKPTIPSVEGLASTEYVDNAVSNITIDTSNLATKDELNTKANSVHTHISSDITGLSIVATSGDYNDLLKKPVIPTVDVNKEYVDAQLSTKANISDIPDLTGYALKTEIPSVPANTSELVNDSGFLTSVPNEYITETELSAKGYLVSSDIVGKANISDLSSVATTGDYNDLLNKPNVTNGKDGENGATFTPNVDTDGNLSWTNDKELENPTTINIKGAKGDKGEQGEKGADGKDGQDGLTTSISLNGTVYSHVDGTITLPDYPTIPTKTSQLTNDSGFINSIPSEYITETELNEKGYLTEHQDISGKANISDLSAVATSGNYNDLINKPTIPSIEGLATEAFVEEKLAGLGSQPETFVQVSVTGNTLQLTKDKYQYSVLSSGNGISLPSVSSFAEIHLFFKTTSEITLVLPSVRWQTQPTIQANKTYEFIFTYVKDEWLGGVVEYV